MRAICIALLLLALAIMAIDAFVPDCIRDTAGNCSAWYMGRTS